MSGVLALIRAISASYSENNEMKKSKFISFILAAFLSLVGCGRSPSDLEMHPGLAEHIPASQDLNVIIVSFDALRTDALGVYGSTSEASPNLDALAKNALVFDNAYSAAQRRRLQRRLLRSSLANFLSGSSVAGTCSRT